MDLPKEKKHTKTKKHRVALLVTATILFATPFMMKKAASSYPDSVEKAFSNGIFPVTSRMQTGFANLFPFSLYEIVLVLLALFILYRIFRFIQAIFSKRFAKEALRFFIYGYTLAATGFFLFHCLWNLNNYRIPLKDQLGLVVEETSITQLSETYEALVIKANTIRPALDLSEDTHIHHEKVKNVLNTAWQGYPPLSRSYPLFHSKRVRVKGLFFSRIQTISGYTGVYSFLTGEPNINIEPPLVTLPHTACHEIAHQMGITFEDEANYAGFLACKKHPDTLFQYSGYLSALTYTGNALYAQAPDLYAEISSLLCDEIKADQREIRDFWEKNQKKKARELADRINNAYLKNNNQPEGLQSYGKFVDLLIADYLSDGIL